MSGIMSAKGHKTEQREPEGTYASEPPVKRYFTSGEFARQANVTLRTIRFYDARNLLKPSFRNENGNRYYTDEDLARLQQILLLKYLGFSLEEIREMLMVSMDLHFLEESLSIQKKLVQERIDELHAVLEAIDETSEAIHEEEQINWNSMINLIHLTAIERSLKNQYLNASNISARIRLHRDYSVNKEGWFHWVYRLCGIHEGARILELGCGSGALWTENRDQIPHSAEILLSDVSDGMVHDAERAIGEDSRFTFAAFDAQKIPYPDDSFDLVIANHVLFYMDDVSAACSEIRRVLRPGGKLAASTYGREHMKEITDLVQGFSNDIVLSEKHLYETFGLDNGRSILEPYFTDIECMRYEDAIELNEAEPLILYILSCHGNQNHILNDRYRDFYEYVVRRVKNGFHITKDAGLFLCRCAKNSGKMQKKRKST